MPTVVTAGAVEVCLCYRFVVFEGEHQRDVDVDALGDQCFNRWNPRSGRGHLDHDVEPRDVEPQTSCFRDGCFGVTRAGGRYFKTHEAVGALRAVEHRPKHIGGHLNVFNHQALGERGVADVRLKADDVVERVVVLGTAG